MLLAGRPYGPGMTPHVSLESPLFKASSRLQSSAQETTFSACNGIKTPHAVFLVEISPLQRTGLPAASTSKTSARNEQ
jgi:hypothetical protein